MQVQAASVRDPVGAGPVLAEAKARATDLQLVWADGRYQGPLVARAAATEPVVRWRCSTFSTNETETLNCAATATTVRPGWPHAVATRSCKPRDYAFIPKICPQIRKPS